MEWDLEKRIKQLKEVGYKVIIVDNTLIVESETIKKKINISDAEIFFEKGRYRVLSNIDLLIARKEQENWLKIFRENKPKKELMNNTKKAYSSPTITIKKEFDFDLHSDILQKFKELKQIGYEVNFIKDDYELKCTDKDVNEDWLSFLDFRDFNEYKKDVERFNPDYIFHLGAYTDLEFCEQNADETYLTNTLAVENAVYLANKLNIPLLYISTAGIFDGKKELYDDWDMPNPLGVYARSKYMGERFVVENAKRFLVCRAGWMMGAGPKKDKKFIQKLMKQLKEGKKELFIVNDKDGTPTFTHDFAKNVKSLIEQEYWGLYNMVCGGQTSRYEVAQELLNILILENEVKLTPVSSEYFKDIYFAERPPCERLDNRKLRIRNLNLMQDWKTALKEYINKNYFDYLKD